MANKIYRTKKDNFGKFVSLSIDENNRKAVLHFGNVAPTDGMEIITKKEMIGKLILCHHYDYEVNTIVPDVPLETI